MLTFSFWTWTVFVLYFRVQNNSYSSKNHRFIYAHHSRRYFQRPTFRTKCLFHSNYLIYRELSGSRLVRCYGNLYSQGRVETLEKLDTLPQLVDATELKSKILFSVVVVSYKKKNSWEFSLTEPFYSIFVLVYLQLAFRSTQAMLNQKKEQVKRLLFYPTPSSSAHVELEASICSYLRRTVDTFDLTQCIEVKIYRRKLSFYNSCHSTPPNRAYNVYNNINFFNITIFFLLLCFTTIKIRFHVWFRKWVLSCGRRYTITRVWKLVPDSINTSATRCVWLGHWSIRWIYYNNRKDVSFFFFLGFYSLLKNLSYFSDKIYG